MARTNGVRSAGRCLQRRPCRASGRSARGSASQDGAPLRRWDVLVQAFERRIVTYTPDNPPGWQVEMGNVGQHYHGWRYGR